MLTEINKALKELRDEGHMKFKICGPEHLIQQFLEELKQTYAKNPEVMPFIPDVLNEGIIGTYRGTKVEVDNSLDRLEFVKE